jgi:hypothetical protein
MPPRRLDGRLPRDLETVCLNCLRKEPAWRYATAADLAADLRRFLAGEPVLARRVGGVERLWRWCRRNPAMAAMKALAVFLLVAVATVTTYAAIQRDRRANEAEQREAQAVALRKEAEAAREKTQVALVRSWLGPLGLRDNEPLIDAEISALWQLAQGQRLWERFVREALSTPETTRQLRNRAGPVLHAAIGLNPERRAAVESLLLERMQDTTLGEDHRTNVALAAVALENQAPASTAAAAAILVQALGKTTDATALNRLAAGLSELAARIGPDEAVATAAVLVQALSKTADARALSQLAQGLSALAARMGPKEAAATAAVLVQALSKTTDADALNQLAEGLSALAASMGPKDGARFTTEAAAVLVKAMRKTIDAIALSQLAQGLSGLTTRMGPEDGARLSTEAAAVLAQALSFSPDARDRHWLAEGLSALAARMEPREAGHVSAEAAATLAKALSKTTKPVDLCLLAEGLSALAVRLEPKDGARVRTEAAAILVQAMSKTTDTSPPDCLAQGLSALAPRMEPKGAAGVAATLTSAISSTYANLTEGIAQGLTAVLNGSEPPERSRRAVAVAGVFGTIAGTGHPVVSLPLLGPAVEPLPCVLSTQQLVDLLKLPTCQDPARRVVLDYLEYCYHRPFRNHWEFVEYAREHLADLDLDSPPRRPGR